MKKNSQNHKMNIKIQISNQRFQSNECLPLKIYRNEHATTICQYQFRLSANRKLLFDDENRNANKEIHRQTEIQYNAKELNARAKSTAEKKEKKESNKFIISQHERNKLFNTISTEKKSHSECFFVPCVHFLALCKNASHRSFVIH